ncbi:MAG: ATP-binding protein [Planctomycetota bacterium]
MDGKADRHALWPLRLTHRISVRYAAVAAGNPTEVIAVGTGKVRELSPQALRLEIGDVKEQVGIVLEDSEQLSCCLFEVRIQADEGQAVELSGPGRLLFVDEDRDAIGMGRTYSVEIRPEMRDEEHREQYEEMLVGLSARDERTTAERLGALAASCRLAGRGMTLKDLLSRLVAAATRMTACRTAALSLVDEETGELVFQVAAGARNEELSEVRIAAGEGICGWVVQHGRPLIVNDVRNDSRRLPGADEILGFEARSVLCVPLLARGRVIGAIELINPPDGGHESWFDREDQEVLTAFAAQAAVAIENARLYQALESTMSGVVESMAEGVILTDEREEVRLINPTARALLGVRELDDATEAVKKLQTDVRLLELLATARAGGRCIEKDVHLRGERARTLATRSVPVRTIEGRLRGAVMTMLDVTDVRALQEMKREFVSHVSHELRTPLTSIKGSIDNLRDGLAGALNDQQARYLERMRSNTSRLMRFIDEILELSRLEEANIPLLMRRVSLAGIAERAAEELGDLARAKNISVRLAHDSPAWTRGEPERLKQVFTNLIGNAIKYTPKGGSIEVRTEDTGDGVARASVADTGVGIAPENLEKIFDKFYQVERGEGSGLGLSIARRLVELHGGRIRVASEPGKGSTFTVELASEAGAGDGTADERR